eukprot:5378881-Amphidinium_carterae.1
MILGFGAEARPPQPPFDSSPQAQAFAWGRLVKFRSGCLNMMDRAGVVVVQPIVSEVFVCVVGFASAKLHSQKDAGMTCKLFS